MEYRLIGYKNEFGEICCPEGFLDELKDRSIENQVKRYRWVWGKISLQRHNHKSQQKPSQPTLKRRCFFVKSDAFLWPGFGKEWC